jgi:hypothetical protein
MGAKQHPNTSTMRKTMTMGDCPVHVRNPANVKTTNSDVTATQAWPDRV